MAKLTHKSGFKRYELVILGNAKREKNIETGNFLQQKDQFVLNSTES